jgi:tRNA A-37 threonylcarbamoyl transferase component Bud32
MRFDLSYPVTLCDRKQDCDYVRAVAEAVYACYPGAGSRWQLVDSDRMWRISFGGRAGVLGVRLDGRTGCVKLFYDERLFNRLRILAGFSKARRAYRHGRRLRQLGVACPEMWGYVERWPGKHGMIVTELIEDAQRLDLWIAQHGVSRDMIGALARFIRHMHDQGVSHMDLSPRNIFVRLHGRDFEFLLLDYEDARFARRVSRRRRLENLHHLHERLAQSVSVRNRLHFLHTYAPEDYKAWRNVLRRRLARKIR